MARFYGTVGFTPSYEDPTNPGVWIEEVIERNYYGDEISNSRSISASTNGVIGNINTNSTISILADEYAINNFSSIKYVVWMNTKWVISSVSKNEHRLNLVLGGIYNE